MTATKPKLFDALEKGKFLAAFPKFVERWNEFAKFWNALKLSNGISLEKRGQTSISVVVKYI